MKRTVIAVVLVLIGFGCGLVIGAQDVRKNCQPFPTGEKDMEQVRKGLYPEIELTHSDVLERLQVTVKPGTFAGKFVYQCR